MATMTFDPQGQLGAAAKGATGLPVIIGLPSRVMPGPHFVIGVTTVENADTSSQITGMPITDGDLAMKSARNAGRYTFDLVISASPVAKNGQVIEVTKVINQIANVANAIFGGGNIFSALGASSGFVASQINALQQMKDGFQPIFALNLYMPLATFSINSSMLASSWYIETLKFRKDEAEDGVVATITVKELLSKISFGSPTAIIQNLANVLLGPGVGSALG